MFNFDDWKNITAIATSFYHTVGLKKDGTLISVGDNIHNQCNVYNRTDIKLP